MKLRKIVMMINWLIGVHVNTEKSIYVNCGEVKRLKSAKDGQLDTMHNGLHYTTTMQHISQ